MDKVNDDLSRAQEALDALAGERRLARPAPRSPSPPINYSELDPGIRGLVRWLRDRGYETTDSGDGSKAATMECALDVPNVTIRVQIPAGIVRYANDIADELKAAGVPLRPGMIHASYDPEDGIAVILIYGIADVDFPNGLT